MRTELIPAIAGSCAATRIVLLPGAFHGPADFVQAGFVAAVRHRMLAVDLLLVEPQLVNLNDRSILQHLHSGAMQPARAAGCSAVWLAGISLGGFLALLYADAFPGELAGLCLLAPYLGSHLITREIDAAGSLAQWRAQPPGRSDELDEERRIWRYLGNPERREPPLYLGFGRSDRFATSLRMLAAQLPKGSVDQVEGGHDWSAWRQLWSKFLVRLTDGGGPAAWH